ncbi:MAG: type IX secretion system membrane protein PorP/SprF [Bacteroidota bacterium]
MRKIIFTLSLLGVMVAAHGQQNAQFSQFMSNKLVQNPAYAGSQDHLCLTALYRSQWVGLEGAPNTQTVSAHMPFFKNRVGVGLSLVRDDITITKHHSVAMSYSYRMDLGFGQVLSIGLQGELKYLRVNWEELQAFDIGDQGLPTVTDRSRVHPNVGAGIYYSTPKFYLGFAAQNLTRPRIELEDQALIDIIPKDRKHFFLMGGMVTSLSDNVQLLPSFLFKYVGNSPLDLDLNASFIFYKKFWMGVSYRFGDSIDGILQYQISPSLRAGIAHDFTLSELRRVNNGTYELLLQYCFDHNPKRLTNPRYF